MPENFFYHHICQWCALQGGVEPMKKCSNCKLVSYCCVEHQKFDWVIHKQLCRALDLIKTRYGKSLFTFQGNCQEKWKQHRTDIMMSVELLLKRKLKLFERQMILFPNVCNICYKYNAAFNPCSNCQCAYYCSKEHLEAGKLNHDKICREIKLSFEVDLYLRDRPYHAVNNISHLNLGEVILPNNIEEYITKYLEIHSDQIWEKVLLSEPLSFVLTLVSVLMNCMKIQFSSLTSLIIHIIGASEHEQTMIGFMDFIFYWLPQLKYINILMIGPDCRGSPLDTSLRKEFSGQKKLLVNKMKMLYHEFTNSEDYVSPHIVVAFNCGFSEYVECKQDTWGETIHCILNLKNVVFVATSYTQQEAESDFSRIICSEIHHSALDVIVQAKRNPFRSLKPLRDWESLTVFYVNNFISVLYIQ